MEYPFELHTNYNDVIFHDDTHEYFVNGKKCISVTTLIHQYENEFEEEYWAEKKANEFQLTTKEIIRAWRFINKKGIMKGSLVHQYGELLFQNKKFEYPKETVIKEFGFDPVYEEYKISISHLDKFHKLAKNKLIPVKLEGIFYDEDSLIAGMADMLFYNITKNEYQIWDYKTNKEFSSKSDFKLKYPFNNIDQCDLEIYSLQLYLYKFLIEKNTKIKIGDSYLVWLSHRNKNFEIIPVLNREKEVEMIYKKRLTDMILTKNATV